MGRQIIPAGKPATCDLLHKSPTMTNPALTRHGNDYAGAGKSHSHPVELANCAGPTNSTRPVVNRGVKNLLVGAATDNACNLIRCRGMIHVLLYVYEQRQIFRRIASSNDCHGRE